VLTDILKSQRPSTFTIESRHRENFSECVECRHSQKSAPGDMFHVTGTAENTFSTFENFCLCPCLVMPLALWRERQSAGGEEEGGGGRGKGGGAFGSRSEVQSPFRESGGS